MTTPPLSAPAPAPKTDPAPAVAPPAAAGPEPTHDLTLSDGRTVPSHGAIPALVHIGEDLLKVVAVTERKLL